MTTTETAPARNRGGRPSRGARVETKLPPADLRDVEGLVGHLGSDRSEVLARLVRHSLAHRDRLAADAAVIRAWAAEDWSETCCGVLLHVDSPRRGEVSVNVWHVDPDAPSGVLDHLHQERLAGVEATAARRLMAVPDDVRELGLGFDSGMGQLVIRCHPDA